MFSQIESTYLLGINLQRFPGTLSHAAFTLLRCAHTPVRIPLMLKGKQAVVQSATAVQCMMGTGKMCLSNQMIAGVSAYALNTGGAKY